MIFFIIRFKCLGYNIFVVHVMLQSACLVLNPVMVDNYAAFFNCTPECRASDCVMAKSGLY